MPSFSMNRLLSKALKDILLFESIGGDVSKTHFVFFYLILLVFSITRF